MLIEVNDVCKSYKTGDVSTKVLKNVKLSMEKGEIGVILGPSGSGKSFFVNISCKTVMIC